MTILTTIWAWFTGLSFVAKLGGGVAALGILSPVVSALTFLWTAIKTVIGWIFQGFENVVAHPVTLSIVVAAWAGGIWQGVDWDKHEVVAARSQAATLVKKVQGAEDVEIQKVKAAAAARDAAEKAAKAVPLLDTEAFATVSPVRSPVSAPTIALNPARPDSVRPGNTNHRRPKCAALFCP